MATINLGDKAKDTITGFEGICVARFCYLNGCIRVSLQPQQLDKDGKIPSSEIIDEAQLEMVQAGAVPVPAVAPGGPRETPRYYQEP